MEINELLEGFQAKGMDAKDVLKQDNVTHMVRKRKTL
jgi:hypothetical protein